MSFDFTALVTDRTQADVDYAQALKQLGLAGMSAAQLQEWFGGLKGTYNAADLNRVSDAMEALVADFTTLGYAVPGYSRVQVQHPAASRLPSGYTELEYIQSTGTQYIDTGISGVYTATFDIQFASSSSRVLIGQDDAVATYWGKDASNRPELGGGVYINADATNRFQATFNRSSSVAYLTVGSTTVQRSGAASTYPFTLFRIGAGDGANYLGTSTLYSAQFSVDSVLVRDYVPCINPDGEAGMYDLVNNQFYGNDGSGSFVTGPEVPSQPDPALDPYTWYENIDIPTQSEMAQYLANMQALAGVIATAQYSVQLPQSMALLTYVGANNIETLLQEINAYIVAISAVFLPAGAVWASAGSPGFYFISN